MRFGQLLLYATSASKSEASKPFPLSLYPAQHGIRLFSSNEPKRHSFTQRNQNYAFHAGRGLTLCTN